MHQIYVSFALYLDMPSCIYYIYKYNNIGSGSLQG